MSYLYNINMSYVIDDVSVSVVVQRAALRSLITLAEFKPGQPERVATATITWMKSRPPGTSVDRDTTELVDTFVEAYADKLKSVGEFRASRRRKSQPS